jgi:hypothetical protein
MSLQFYEILGGKNVLGYRNLQSKILIFGSSHIRTIKNEQCHNLICIPGGGIRQFQLALDAFKSTFEKMKVIIFLDIGNDLLDREGGLLQKSHAIIASTRLVINNIYAINKNAQIISMDVLPRPSLDDLLLTQLDLSSRFMSPFNPNHSHVKTFKMFTRRRGHPRIISQNLDLFQGPTFVHLNEDGSVKLNTCINNLLSTPLCM